MSLAYILIFGSMIVLGTSAVLGLFWAARDGQFSDMKRGARVIFDEDEPEGEPTDIVFETRRERKQRKLSRRKPVTS